MSDVFEGEQWQQQFPGRIATSVVSFQVTHPLVDNAGDILLDTSFGVTASDHCCSLSLSTNKRKPARQH
ncbi:hypothetical protein [Bradyrhizobium sp. ORS 86]|uniref:hypothetical protein n=1 Tax=unclassified Bradyrhizobium TaxID=2631580 RepID=UPI003890F5F6